MAKNLTEVAEYAVDGGGNPTVPVTVPEGLDSHDNAADTVEALSQVLANRAKWLRQEHVTLEAEHDALQADYDALQAAFDILEPIAAKTDRSNTFSGSLTCTGLDTGSGDITGNDITLTGNVVASGTIGCLTVVSAAAFSASANITTSGGDIVATAGDVTAASGTVTGGTVVSNGDVEAGSGDYLYTTAKERTREVNIFQGHTTFTGGAPDWVLLVAGTYGSGWTQAAAGGLIIPIPQLGVGSVLKRVDMLYYMATAAAPSVWLTQHLSDTWSSPAKPTISTSVYQDSTPSGAGWKKLTFTPGTPFTITAEMQFEMTVTAGGVNDLVSRIRFVFDDPGPRNY